MCWSRRRDWPTRPRARAPATGASTSREWPRTRAWTSRKGASALRELARVVETVSGWTDLKRGLTVSVGVAGGGTKTNVIPAEAWAEVDVRIARKADGPRIERKFAALKRDGQACSLTVTGGINRPPMERTRGTVKLYRKAQRAGRGTGFHARRSRDRRRLRRQLHLGARDSDAGRHGRGGRRRACAHESVLLEHLAPRTALLAGMLAVHSSQIASH